MSYIKKYLEFITEKKATKAEVYNKYYNAIEPEIYNKIVSADPSAKGESIGVYTQWLLKLYLNKNLRIEDLYKVTEYLKTFKEFHGKLGRDIKDLSDINSLPELYKLIEPFLQKEDAIFSNEAERALIGQYKQVFKNDEYRIIIPLTLKASQYFGQDTEWCTTNSDQFKQYTENQDPNIIDQNCLYILYSENPDNRYQFSFVSRQFMDETDEEIAIDAFFEAYPDIFKFFNSHFDTRVYTDSPDVIMVDYAPKYDLKMDVISLISEGYDTFEDYKEQNPDWISEFDIIADDFDFDELPMDGSPTISFNFIYNSKENLKKFQLMIKDTFNPSDITVVDCNYDDCSNMYINL